MVIDSSALIAILTHEAEKEQFLDAIVRTPQRFLSSANLLETAIVMTNRVGQLGGKLLDEFISASGITVVSVTLEQINIARQAFYQYGKGRHPAALNFGDCFAYSLAKFLNQPLLFKGTDFSQTDLIGFCDD